MPWKAMSIMSQRIELISLAGHAKANLGELARRFGVSRKTLYKWLDRHRAGGAEALADRSRRPTHSPAQCSPEVEKRVTEAREKHPAWGARKLRRWLLDQGHLDLASVPAASTVHRILVRRGFIDDQAWRKHTAYLRFEYPEPNDLWQMDFKGHFPLRQGRCHPLCVLDDHSRYALVVRACGQETAAQIREALTQAFRRYGMPAGMLMDNGSPWAGHSKLTLWMMRLGVRVLHGRPAHPQTQGKLERFNRTLQAEAIGTQVFADLAACQSCLDPWRDLYNFQRPHEALGMATPATRYQHSPRSFPEVLPPIEYGPADKVLSVHASTGCIPFQGRRWPVGTAFGGLPVGVRPTGRDGVYDVYFCHQRVAKIDLHVETTDPVLP
jgi:transposase InsO family protein